MVHGLNDVKFDCMSSKSHAVDLDKMCLNRANEVLCIVANKHLDPVVIMMVFSRSERKPALTSETVSSRR